MTGTDRIKEKIRKDAVEAALIIQQEAKAEAELLLSAAKAQRSEAEATTVQQIEQRIAAIKQRNEATYQLEKRKQVLTVRQSVVQASFTLAAEAMRKLPLVEYEALLLSMARQFQWPGDATLLVSEEDHARLGTSFLEKLDMQRKTLGLVGKTTYAEDTLAETGGFVVRTGDIEMNGKLDIIVTSIRPKLERQVADILFKGEALEA